jgi:hypothetical protein
MMQPIWNGVLHNLKVNLNAMSLLLWCDRGALVASVCLVFNRQSIIRHRQRIFWPVLPRQWSWAIVKPVSTLRQIGA